MNVKEILKNYRQNSLKLSIAKANGRMTSELEDIERDMKIVDMAIEYIKPDYIRVVNAHFKEGISYETLGKNLYCSKVGIVNRTKRAINAIEKLLN